MNEKDVLLRERLMDRIDEALNRWPRRDNPGFLKEINAIAAGLDKLAHESEERKDEAAERSKCWRYAGMAHFERGMALCSVDNKGFVEEMTASSLCYERTLSHLKSTQDVRQVAVTHFNYANTLRALSDGSDVRLLEASDNHYRAALEGFKQAAPENVAETERSLATLQAQLSLARMQDQVKSKVSRFEKLEAELHSVGNMDTASTLLMNKVSAVLVSGPSPREIANEAAGAVAVVSSALGIDGGSGRMPGLTSLVDKLNGLAVSAAPSTGDEEMMSALVAMLRSRLQEDVSSGKVSALRQKSLQRILDELEIVLRTSPQGLDGMTDKITRMRQLTAVVMELMKTPSVGKPDPPEGTLAACILPHWAILRTQLAMALNVPHREEEERRVSMELMKRVAESTDDLYNAGANEPATNAVESEVLLPLTGEVRRYMRRRHAMLCHPVWGTVPATMSYRSVFFSGGAQTGNLVTKVCKRRKLSVFKTPPGENVAISRWCGLCTAGVSVFDLSLEPGPHLAQVSYELGIARSLGKPAVVLASRERTVPFNVDIEPVRISGTPEDDASLLAALDEALYSIPADDYESSMDETIEFARIAIGSESERFEVKKTLEMLEEASADSLLACNRLQALLGLLRGERPEILFPPWKPHYASPTKRRCFHVMPFSESWSDGVCMIAREACKAVGMPYVRGDEVADPDIIRSIWNEICGASHVLVDLTGLNANVALELGISHTIGKRVLPVAKGEMTKNLFPAIAKLRVAEYESTGTMDKLRRNIHSFLSETG